MAATGWSRRELELFESLLFKELSLFDLSSGSWKTPSLFAKLSVFSLTQSFPREKGLFNKSILKIIKIAGNGLTLQCPEVVDNRWGKQSANQKASKEKLESEMLMGVLKSSDASPGN